MTAVTVPVPARDVIEEQRATRLEEIANETMARAATQRLGNPVLGDLRERIQAFNEMSSAFAPLRLNGWDTITKCKMACWLGDAWMVHPAVVMQGCWCIELDQGAKLIVEPKWTFQIDLMTARLPGFHWKVIEDTDEACEVWMSYNGNEHTYRYTLKDAERQGLLSGGRFNAWKGGNKREMLKAKAVGRCGDTVGGGIFSGIIPDPEQAVTASRKVAVTEPAAAYEQAAGVTDAGRQAAGVETLGGATATRSGPADAEIAIERLGKLIDQMWNNGKKMGAVAKLRVFSTVLSQMKGATVVVERAKDIAESDAIEAYDWLMKKYPDGKIQKAPPKEAAGNGDVGSASPEPTKDAGAPAAEAPAPRRAPLVGEQQQLAPNSGGHPAEFTDEEWDALLESRWPGFKMFPVDQQMELEYGVLKELHNEGKRQARIEAEGRAEVIMAAAIAAKKSHPTRTLVAEDPPGEGRWFFVDMAICQNLGWNGGPMLLEGGRQVIAPADCRMIVRELKKAGIKIVLGLSER